MAENSKIEWTHHTFSPWAGCENDGLRVAAAESYWRSPIEWDREASAAGERRRVFCAPWADVFEAWPGPMVDSLRWPLVYDGGEYKTWSGPIAECPYRSLTMDDVRARLFWTIDATPNLDWLVLTKRPENIARMMPGTTRPNLWIGTSIENQAAADERIPHLLNVPAAVRFLSVEPLLGPVDLTRSVVYQADYYCGICAKWFDSPGPKDHCPNCGHEHNDEACPECGESDYELTCPECDHDGGDYGCMCQYCEAVYAAERENSAEESEMRDGL